MNLPRFVSSETPAAWLARTGGRYTPTRFVSPRGTSIPPGAAAMATRVATRRAERAPKPATLEAIVKRWEREGPLVRVATGLAPLDAMCRGGLPISRRVTLVGAPGSCKTGLALSMIHYMATVGGLCVGILAVDEEPEDLAVRVAQMHGVTLDEAERRSPKVMQKLARDVLGLRMRLYDFSWTIEAAAADLAAWGAQEGCRTALMIDSIQAASSDVGRVREAEANSPRAIVEANVRAVRSVSTGHRMIVIATSEANRASYTFHKGEAPPSDMAAGAESRAIEFSAQTLLVLKPHRDGTFQVRVTKNRRYSTGDFVLALDRTAHRFAETTSTEADPAAREERRRARVTEDALALAEIVAAHPGLGTRDLRSRARSREGWGVERFETARARLEDGVGSRRLVNLGPNRQRCAWHLADGVSGVTGVSPDVSDAPGVEVSGVYGGAPRKGGADTPDTPPQPKKKSARRVSDSTRGDSRT